MFTRPEWVKSVQLSWVSSLGKVHSCVNVCHLGWPPLPESDGEGERKRGRGDNWKRSVAGAQWPAHWQQAKCPAQWPLTFALVILSLRCHHLGSSSTVFHRLFLSLPPQRPTCWCKQSLHRELTLQLTLQLRKQSTDCSSERQCAIIAATQCLLLRWTCNCASRFIYLLHFKAIHSSFPTTSTAPLPPPWFVVPASLMNLMITRRRRRRRRRRLLQCSSLRRPLTIRDLLAQPVQSLLLDTHKARIISNFPFSLHSCQCHCPPMTNRLALFGSAVSVFLCVCVCVFVCCKLKRSECQSNY